MPINLDIEEVVQPPLQNFIAFMVRLPFTRCTDIANLICRHGGANTRWLLAMEKDKEGREHFHGIAFMEDDEYDKVQRHFRENWNLSGQAKKNGLKEYGRIRKIKDKVKLFSYTVKDDNVVVSDNWDIDLEPFKELSYQKPKFTKKELRDQELLEFIIALSNNKKYISTTNIVKMSDGEFNRYEDICRHICGIYQKYNYDFPVLKTINRLLVRYGVLNVEEAIDDHLSRWFRERIYYPHAMSWKEENLQLHKLLSQYNI